MKNRQFHFTTITMLTEAPKAHVITTFQNTKVPVHQPNLMTALVAQTFVVYCQEMYNTYTC